jgi:hypothetical protein
VAAFEPAQNRTEAAATLNVKRIMVPTSISKRRACQTTGSEAARLQRPRRGARAAVVDKSFHF